MRPKNTDGSWGYGSDFDGRQVWLPEHVVVRLTGGKEHTPRPVRFESRCRTLETMTQAERDELCEQYGTDIYDPNWRFEWGLV